MQDHNNLSALQYTFAFLIEEHCKTMQVLKHLNEVKFYALFAPAIEEVSLENIEVENILDVWILTRLNQLIKQVTENLEKYNLPNASRPITGFIGLQNHPQGKTVYFKEISLHPINN